MLEIPCNRVVNKLYQHCAAVLLQVEMLLRYTKKRLNAYLDTPRRDLMSLPDSYCRYSFDCLTELRLPSLLPSCMQEQHRAKVSAIVRRTASFYIFVRQRRGDVRFEMLQRDHASETSQRLKLLASEIHKAVTDLDFLFSFCSLFEQRCSLPSLLYSRSRPKARWATS
jgi:hypothetical protein